MPLRSKLVGQINRSLDEGYRIVVPKEASNGAVDYNFFDFDFTDIRDDLGATEVTDTEHYELYSRKR